MKYICQSCNNLFKSIKADKNRIPKYCCKSCYYKRIVSQETKIKQSLAKVGKSAWNKGIQMWKDKKHPQGMKGKVSPRKGIKISEETRKKLKESHTGLKCPHNSKQKHWNWKGGITKEIVSIRASANYKNWRIQVFERDEYKCQICFQIGGYLNADHILPFCEYPEKRFDIQNGRTLCKSCHLKTETYGGKMHKKLKDRK